MTACFFSFLMSLELCFDYDFKGKDAQRRNSKSWLHLMLALRHSKHTRQQDRKQLWMEKKKKLRCFWSETVRREEVALGGVAHLDTLSMQWGYQSVCLGVTKVNTLNESQNTQHPFSQGVEQYLRMTNYQIMTSQIHWQSTQHILLEQVFYLGSTEP